jgi:hypothetical protein
VDTEFYDLDIFKDEITALPIDLDGMWDRLLLNIFDKL